jgi:creatinine amidohydrolase
MSDSFVLFDMSWPEVKANLDKIKVVLIPVGSCEQHGPNGTFEVDTAIANEFTKRLAAMTYPLTIATPPVNFGVSPHHMKFPGTIFLKPDTFIQVCVDVAEAMYRHGFRKFMFVNGHGGNQGALNVVLQKLKFSLPDIEVGFLSPWGGAQDVMAKKVTSPITGHACEVEMSMSWYLAPRTVKVDSLTKGALNVTPEEYKLPWGIYIIKSWEENTSNGALGDATKATCEFGEELIETSLTRIADVIKDFAKS